MKVDFIEQKKTVAVENCGDLTVYIQVSRRL